MPARRNNGDRKVSNGPKKVKRTIGSVAEEAIRRGASNADALRAVKKRFPEAGTSLPCMNWYRNKLRKAGEPVPTQRELSRWERAMA